MNKGEMAVRIEKQQGRIARLEAEIKQRCRESRETDTELIQLKEKAKALEKELTKEAMRFHSWQYCNCNWCQIAKKQASLMAKKQALWKRKD